MNPKNLLQHTIKCFKSFFTGQTRYLKVLEATPSYSSCCCSTMHGKTKYSSSFRDLDEFYSGLITQFDAATATYDKDTAIARCTRTKPEKALSKRKRNKGIREKAKIQTPCATVRNPERKSLEIGSRGDQGGNGGKKEDVRSSLVVEKLQEMKKMDERNSEHLTDIDEIIFYYSLITSQTYLEIVDKFFVDLYSEFRVFPGSVGSHRHRLVKV